MNYRDPKGLNRQRGSWDCEWNGEGWDCSIDWENGPVGGGTESPGAPEQGSVGGGRFVNEIAYMDVPGFYTAWMRLDPKCAGFVGNGMSAVDARNALMGQDFFRIFELPTPTNGTVARADGGSAIALNTAAFFNPTNMVEVSVTAAGVTSVTRDLVADFATYYKLDPAKFGVAQFQAVVLLHELGHNLGGLPSDLNSPAQSLENTADVINNCFQDMKR